MTTTRTHETPPCMICGERSSIDLPADVAAALGTVPIQDLLPATSPAERELIRTGTHPACWRMIFGAPE